MSLTLRSRAPRGRLGLKGPRAADWLTAQGIALPMAPNTWTTSRARDAQHGAPGARAEDGAVGGAVSVHDVDGVDDLLVARLGSAEFFLEDGAHRGLLKDIAPAAQTHPSGVYPVLREDAAFLLYGDGAYEVLAQVCNVNFRDLVLDSRPVIMTLMIGVAVLVVASESCFRIWCDPTFGPYLDEALGQVVIESGGTRGAEA